MTTIQDKNIVDLVRHGKLLTENSIIVVSDHKKSNTISIMQFSSLYAFESFGHHPDAVAIFHIKKLSDVPSYML